jgi:hypothetical protein
MYAKGKNHHFHAPQYRNFLRKVIKYSMVQGVKMWKWDKNTIFLSPINFLQVFLSQVGKTGPGVKYYIVSPQAYIQEAV